MTNDQQTLAADALARRDTIVNASSRWRHVARGLHRFYDTVPVLALTGDVVTSLRWTFDGSDDRNDRVSAPLPADTPFPDAMPRRAGWLIPDPSRPFACNMNTKVLLSVVPRTEHL